MGTCEAKGQKTLEGKSHLDIFLRQGDSPDWKGLLKWVSLCADGGGESATRWAY